MKPNRHITNTVFWLCFVSAVVLFTYCAITAIDYHFNPGEYYEIE